MNKHTWGRGKTIVAVAAMLLGVVVVPELTPVAQAQTAPPPTFAKSFNPATIGPGSVSTLTFTVTNADSVPAEQLAFTDVLPAGVVIAAPANAARHVFR